MLSLWPPPLRSRRSSSLARISCKISLVCLHGFTYSAVSFGACIADGKGVRHGEGKKKKKSPSRNVDKGRFLSCPAERSCERLAKCQRLLLRTGDVSARRKKHARTHVYAYNIGARKCKTHIHRHKRATYADKHELHKGTHANTFHTHTHTPCTVFFFSQCCHSQKTGANRSVTAKG